MVSRASANETIHLDERGQRVYPCRCGETHRGDYAAYDYDHHNCFHNAPLYFEPWLNEGRDDGYAHLLCPLCGKSFFVKRDSAVGGLQPGEPK